MEDFKPRSSDLAHKVYCDHLIESLKNRTEDEKYKDKFEFEVAQEDYKKEKQKDAALDFVKWILSDEHPYLSDIENKAKKILEMSK